MYRPGLESRTAININLQRRPLIATMAYIIYPTAGPFVRGDEPPLVPFVIVICYTPRRTGDNIDSIRGYSCSTRDVT